MATYYTTSTVQAEQYLPKEDKIPAGAYPVTSRLPTNTMAVLTPYGERRLTDGDYVMTNSDGRWIVPAAEFEARYKPQ